jgi:hypothetical protein
MAGTYYKYAERDVDSQVNWAQVGKDLSDMLLKETELREQKKAEIDKQSRELGQRLENLPTGNSDEVNAWTTNFASDMQSYRLLTDKLLKSGNLKLKDYNLIRQNTLDGTTNVLNLSKEFQAEFDEKMKRRMEDVSSEAETQMMAFLEGFSNLAKTKPVINAATGAVSLAKMEKGPDGVLRIKEGNDSTVTSAQARERLKLRIDKYKLNDALASEVKLMGKVVEEVQTAAGTIYSQGMITKLSDPTQRKGLKQEGQEAVNNYLDIENKIIESKTSNPFHVSSILFDWSGGVDPNTNTPYQITFDKDLAATSSHYILWAEQDGVLQPDFESTDNGKLQYNNAKEYSKLKFRSMLEQSKELKPTSQLSDQRRTPTSTDYERQDLQTKADNFGKNVAFLVAGNEAQKRLAVDYFRGIQGIKGFEVLDNAINILRGSQSIPYEYRGSAIDYASSLISNLNRDVGLPENMIMNAVQRFLPNQNISRIKLGRIENLAARDYKPEVAKYSVDNVVISEDNPQATTAYLNDKFGKLGFSFSGGTDGATDDYIIAVSPTGAVSPRLQIDDLSNLSVIIKFIQDNFDPNLAGQMFEPQNEQQGNTGQQGGQQGGAPRP